MLHYTECNFLPLSSGFVEICQLVFRNDPVTTKEFYAFEILFSGQFKKEGGSCMTEQQINFTVFTLASFLFSQRLYFLGDWALHGSFVTAAHNTQAEDVREAVCHGWFYFVQMWLNFTQLVRKTHL